MGSHGVPRVSATTLDHSDASREREQRQIAGYQELEADVRGRIGKRDYSNDTLQATSRLLTQNPEYYTIWNYRRLILQDVFAKETQSSGAAATESTTADDADQQAAQKAGLTLAQQEISLLLKEDLQFLIPLLKQFPKCYWIWNHRSWLLGVATKHLPAGTACQLWQGELALVSKMLALDNRNFHGWGYRRHVVSQIEVLSGQSMVEKEFEYTTKMIHTKLSNFSAWHYRGRLIPKLLAQRCATTDQRRKLFDSELELITQALYTDSHPYDQSVWFYHNYLMSTLDPLNDQAPPILDPCTDAERLRYLEQEIESLRDMMDGAEDNKYIYQALLDYSHRYLELQTGDEKVSAQDVRGWLEALRKLDPLREGRWRDLEAKMKL